MKASAPHVVGMNEMDIKHEHKTCDLCILGKLSRTSRMSSEGIELDATRAMERSVPI